MRKLRLTQAKLLSHKLVTIGIWICNFLSNSSYGVPDTMITWFNEPLLIICILSDLRPMDFLHFNTSEIVIYLTMHSYNYKWQLFSPSSLHKIIAHSPISGIFGYVRLCCNNKSEKSQDLKQQTFILLAHTKSPKDLCGSPEQLFSMWWLGLAPPHQHVLPQSPL